MLSHTPDTNIYKNRILKRNAFGIIFIIAIQNTACLRLIHFNFFLVCLICPSVIPYIWFIENYIGLWKVFFPADKNKTLFKKKYGFIFKYSTVWFYSDIDVNFSYLDGECSSHEVLIVLNSKMTCMQSYTFALFSLWGATSLPLKCRLSYHVWLIVDASE